MGSIAPSQAALIWDKNNPGSPQEDPGKIQFMKDAQSKYGNGYTGNFYSQIEQDYKSKGPSVTSVKKPDDKAATTVVGEAPRSERRTRGRDLPKLSSTNKKTLLGE